MKESEPQIVSDEKRMTHWMGQGAAFVARLLKFLRQHLLPGVKRWLVMIFNAIRQWVLPAVGTGSSRLKGEIVKIHRQQNWIHRCRTTFSGNAAGLGVAMLSTKLVESLVETREASNLWGLLADRPLVSERTFEILSFSAEYIFALIVFTVTEYYIGEYQRKKSEGLEPSAVVSNDEREG